MNDTNKKRVRFTIRNKLITGFFCIFAIFITTIILTTTEISNTVRFTQRFISKDLPLMEHIQAVNMNLQRSLANLKSWLLTNNEKYKMDRKNALEHLNYNVNKVDQYIEGVKNPKIREKWQQVKILLKQLDTAQDKVEKVAHTDDQNIALSYYKKNIAEQYNQSFKFITQLINLEKNQPTSDTRK